MGKTVLINAANLHVGGGVQVAVSFIYEMCSLSTHDFSLVDVIVSTAVDEGLSRLNCDTSIFRLYRVFDLYGLRAFWSPLNREVKKYDTVFTVFGPNYLRVKSNQEIVGFAQPWILDPVNPVMQGLGFFSRLRLKLQLYVQKFFFSRSDQMIVELEHVKRKLLAIGMGDLDTVSVVYNTVSSIYFDPSSWGCVSMNRGADVDLMLGLVSRDYRHKNISIFRDVAEVLLRKYGLRVRFYVTFNDAEWKARSFEFKKWVTNVGALQPNECPSFYEQVDGVVFPSLLECFSAAPLESLVMERPLFASNRDFIRDICGDYAFYFDPLDAHSVADVIASYYLGGEDKGAFLQAAKAHAIGFSSASERAKKYLEIALS